VVASEGFAGLRAVSLCSGSGMLEVGVAAVVPGLRVVCYCEWEAYPASLLVERMEQSLLEPAPIWCGDFSRVEWSAWSGAVDIVVAGIPCQPFSVAGKKKGTSDERWIWSDAFEVIRKTGADVVFLENVPGLLTEGLGIILEDLSQIGFDAVWSTFKAQDVGAPHSRNRVFILAYTDSGRRKVEWVSRVFFGQFGDHFDRCDRPGGDVDDADGSRRQQISEGVCGDEVEDGSKHGDVSSGSGEDFPHSSCSRLDYNLSLREREEVSGACDSCSGYFFVPRPCELGDWEMLLRSEPGLEPAVCGKTDGLADVLVDRIPALRLTGNGVVPLQVAVAFACLANRVANSR
jgi:DNA (cytosine-5)-methyltransferase 1